MKQLVQLTADQIVQVRGVDTQYDGTREEFKVDWGEEAPAYPDGVDEVIYEPGVRHAYNKDHSTVDGGPMPWPKGDELLARVDVVVADKRIREQEQRKKAEEEERLARIREADAMMERLKKESRERVARMKDGL